MTTRTTQAQPTVSVKITNDRTTGYPAGKLADAELHFHGGPLDGIKLIGFAVWERRSGSGRNVTFPARQYSVNGERRAFSLLRPVGGDPHAQDRVRELVLQAYAEQEDAAAQPAPKAAPSQLDVLTGRDKPEPPLGDF